MLAHKKWGGVLAVGCEECDTIEVAVLLFEVSCLSLVPECGTFVTIQGGGEGISTLLISPLTNPLFPQDTSHFQRYGSTILPPNIDHQTKLFLFADRLHPMTSVVSSSGRFCHAGSWWQNWQMKKMVHFFPRHY